MLPQESFEPKMFGWLDRMMSESRSRHGDVVDEIRKGKVGGNLE